MSINGVILPWLSLSFRVTRYRKWLDHYWLCFYLLVHCFNFKFNLGWHLNFFYDLLFFNDLSSDIFHLNDNLFFIELDSIIFHLYFQFNPKIFHFNLLKLSPILFHLNFLLNDLSPNMFHMSITSLSDRINKMPLNFPLFLLLFKLHW